MKPDTDFYKAVSQTVRLLEDGNTPENVKATMVEELTFEITDIVNRLNYNDAYVIEQLWPVVKDLEARGKVWGKDGSAPKTFDRSLMD